MLTNVTQFILLSVPLIHSILGLLSVVVAIPIKKSQPTKLEFFFIENNIYTHARTHIANQILSEYGNQ
jgi:hypothetical protein